MDQNECLVCDRVDSASFYKGLRELNFSENEARIALKLLSDIYFKDVTFFAGNTKGVIKASIAYTLSIILKYNEYGKEKRITQDAISDTFQVSLTAVRTRS